MCLRDMLWGVVQGAQYEDLLRHAARTLAEMDVNGQIFDGFGIGGALQKENLGTIVSWVSSELPEDRPRPVSYTHLNSSCSSLTRQ